MAHAAKQCAEELARLAETLLGKVPDDREWGSVRRFLNDTCKLLRRGDFKAGLRAFYRLLPYIQHAFSQVDKYAKVVDTYEVTETIREHFLVDGAARDHVEKVMAEIKNKMSTLRENIEVFGQQLDELLEGIITHGRHVGLWTSVKLAFQMNRISAMISTCEDGLRRARVMVDQLDTHVAGKSLLASLLAYVAFIGSVAFSASGNLPVGAACLATATASRKSAQGLAEYRTRLADIDRQHQDLQNQLSEWRFRFRAEQRNFLLLVGLKYSVFLLVVIGILFFMLGKASNFLFFSAVIIYLVVKSEETNHMRYYAALGVGVVAMVTEWHEAGGLVVFNMAATMFILCKFLGFLEVI